LPVNSEVLKYCRTLLGETTQNKYLDTELIRAWDYAQKDFSKKTEILQTELSIAGVSGTKDYAMTSLTRPIKIRKIVWDWNTSNAYRLANMDFDDYPHGVENQTGRPQFYVVWNDQIRIYPTPDESKSFRVYYVFSASSINDTVAFSANSEISQIPERWHQAVAHYAVAQMLEKYATEQGIDAKIARMLSVYEKAVGDARLLENRPADETTPLGFKGLMSPAFDGEQGGYGGYTGRPLL